MVKWFCAVTKKDSSALFAGIFILMGICAGTVLAYAEEGQVVKISSEAIQLSIKDLSQEERISVDELRDWQLKKVEFVLFDARGKKSYTTGHIQGAILPLAPEYYRQDDLFKSGIIASPPDRDRALAEGTQRYSNETQIVTYCNRNCNASTILLVQLKKLGFRNVKAMEGGTQVWEEKGCPMDKGISE